MILKLSNCNITDKGLIYLTNVSDLEISKCHKITNKGLKLLRKIKKLKIKECDQIHHGVIDINMMLKNDFSFLNYTSIYQNVYY